MKKFDRIKTIQLILLIAITASSLVVILRNSELYALIATNMAARTISVLLWLTLGLSFLFLLYDFSSYPSVDGLLVSYKMGTKVAPWTLGINSTFQIYDFDFSFTMTGKYGHKYMRQAFNYPVSDYNSRMTPNKQYSEIVNCDPMKRIPLPQNEVEDNYGNWTNIADNVSYLVENAGVLRMQEISLSYNLPRSVLRKIGIQCYQFYAMINNAFSIYASSFDEDPEYPRESIKPQPAYTFGLKFQF